MKETERMNKDRVTKNIKKERLINRHKEHVKTREQREKWLVGGWKVLVLNVEGNMMRI